MYPTHLTNHAPDPENARVGQLAYECRASTGLGWKKLAALIGARSDIYAFKHARRHARRHGLAWPPGGHVNARGAARKDPFRFTRHKNRKIAATKWRHKMRQGKPLSTSM